MNGMLDTTIGDPPETSSRYHGWRVVFACFVMATIALGAL